MYFLNIKDKKGLLLDFFKLVSAFLLPVFLICIIMYLKKIVPFGDTDVFIWDAKLQHKDYLGYIIDLLNGKASSQYSTSKSLGGGIPGIIGFYASSPINLLLYFFEKKDIPIFMSIAIILRIGLCGFTSHFYLSRRFRLPFIAILILSTSYALSEYNVYYCRNCMWLDGVIMLPIVAYGVWQLIHYKKSTSLIVSVSIAIISNWYTGYMVCLMATILFFIEFFLNTDNHFIIKRLWSSFFNFALSMVIGAMLSAFSLIPYLLALVGGKATNNKASFSKVINYDILHFFSGFDINAKVNAFDAPIVYCTALLLLLTCYFFFDRNILLKKKIILGISASVIVISFCIREVELLWTAFIESHSYYYRFAFIVPMIMIIISAISLESITLSGIDKISLLKALIFLSVVFYMLQRCGEWKSEGFVLLVYISCFFIYAILIMFLSKYSIKYQSIFFIILLLLISGELLYNTKIAFSDYKESAKMYSKYVTNIEDIISKLNQKSNNSFFRFEKNTSYNSLTGSSVATCESMLFGYNSIEHYSSAYDKNVDDFLAKVGYSDWPDGKSFLCETYWNNPMLVMESILSTRFILSEKQPLGYEELKDINIEVSNEKIYENKFALPLGFNVASSAHENLELGSNPFSNQEQFIDSLVGFNSNLYKDSKLQLVNFNRENGTEEWQIMMLEDGPAYLFIDGEKNHSNYYNDNCHFFINDKENKICQRFSINVIYLGDYLKGDIVSIKIENYTGNKMVHTLSAVQLNIDNYKKIIDKLSTGYLSNLNVEKNRIFGSYYSETDSTVFLSIPYEKNWVLKVDGQPAQPECICNTFIGIPLNAGTHKIELKYTAPGAKEGIVISILGLFIWIAIAFHNHDLKSIDTSKIIKKKRCETHFRYGKF